MKTSRYSDSQIMTILKQAEAGTPVPSGMDASMMSRLKELEDENRRLKKMYAEVQLQADVLKEAIVKKW